MDIRAKLREGKYLLFDGGMGTMLQAAGMPQGVTPEIWATTNPDVLVGIHRKYVEAGADIITTCTFGANRRKLGDDVERIIRAAVSAAREAGAPAVALDIGPTGGMLKPLGDMDFDEAYELFKEQVVAGVKAGADLIVIETMTDLSEARAAVLAAKENSTLPVFCTLSYEKTGRTFLGADAGAATMTLCGLGVDAVGVNCSLGPGELTDVVKRICEYSSVPVIVQANAGLPRTEGDRTVYDLTPEVYAAEVKKLLDFGPQVIGGCCGTTPAFTAAEAAMLAELTDGTLVCPQGRTGARAFDGSVCSDRTIVRFRDRIAVVGERLNPTGKKRISAALRALDFDVLTAEAITEEENGAEILDVNAGLPDICEADVLPELVTVLQGSTGLPLQIDTSDPEALERAVRRYNGKALINSVNGKKESMDRVLAVARKYGAAVIILTLNEAGIPDDADGRIAIAREVMERALSMGIPKTDLIVDGLVMTVSTDQTRAGVTLETVKRAREELGLATALGVSNISFGLPSRELVNSAFLAAACDRGLNLPIIDPTRARYMETIYACRVLSGEDEGSGEYIRYCTEHAASQTQPQPVASPVATPQSGTAQQPGTAQQSGTTQQPGTAQQSGTAQQPGTAPAESSSPIRAAIIAGNKAVIGALTEERLLSSDPIDVINTEFIPALDRVGELYESGRFFLPQLMSAAETAKRGFDVIRAASKGKSSETAGSSRRIVIATVKGDIHDIGKNIVKMLLENYGYDVIDLGKDVDPQLIVDTVNREHIKLLGLSALMTTTVRSMKETIELLRASGSDCKVMVGGAVLTESYAAEVGADFYAKDAAASARIAAGIDWD